MLEPDARIESQAAGWLARRDRGDWSGRDQAAFDAWFAADSTHRVAFVRLQAAWREADRLGMLAAGTGREHLAPSTERIAGIAGSPHGGCLAPNGFLRRRHRNSHPRATRPRWLWLEAAILVAFTLAGAWLMVHHWRSNPGTIDYRTALGTQQDLQLVDGSRVVLGSATDVGVALSRTRRDVALRHGEAFFAVAHDPDRPFVVHADGNRVVAVGTRFDVRRSHHGLRVIVTEGLVRLEAAARGIRPPTALLPAGSVASIRGGEVSIRHVPLERARELLSWRDGYLAFHDTPLYEAADEFNRYNPKKLLISGDAAGAMRVGGRFRYDNLDAFLRMLQQMFPLRVENRGDLVVVTAKARGTHHVATR